MPSDEARSGTAVVGIINVTPDSFSGDGLYDRLDAVAARAGQIEAEGAAMVDLGGQSTRPGATPVDDGEELRRVIPAVECLVAAVSIPISVDTSRTSVARAALAAGATVINDVSGLSDPELPGIIAERDAGLVIVHHAPVEGARVIDSVREGLARLVHRAEARGVERKRIVVDPGLGFGKGWRENLVILRDLRGLQPLGLPILVGPSRKGTIGRVLGVDVHDRLEGTAALVTIAIANGASLVRVHDVREMVRVARMTDAITAARPQV
ncbi:MAG TPA: dihydropteroate synthase [Chloroflexota bacterium]|nr:dihydropteroate synthase [Chloroflexota bacterium]